MTDTRFIPGLLACLALLQLSPALARTEDRWFQVELLVFSNERVQDSEQWQATPVLAYPGAARFLVEPQRVQANLAQYANDNIEHLVDEYGRQIITILPEPDPEASPTPHIPPLDPVQGSVATAATAESPMPPRPTPFIALPAEQREFRGKAAYMQRSGRYRTLFHETWVQPVRDEASALPLVLDRSGDSNDWPRLQGSIRIYLSRYLHIQTNLWLNTPGDYLPGLWRMPPPPLGPPSLVIEDLRPPEPPVAEDAPDPRAGAYQDSMAVPVDPNEALVEETGPASPWRHAVLLQQKRRMRSTEVHYLDHPLFGLVVKLTPLAEEDLAALAEAEVQPW